MLAKKSITKSQKQCIQKLNTKYGPTENRSSLNYKAEQKSKTQFNYKEKEEKSKRLSHATNNNLQQDNNNNRSNQYSYLI